jgi:hypothetical protein
VQGVIEPKPSFICRSKYRKKHRHLDRACSMKPPVATQGKSESGLEVVQRYSDRSSFVFESQDLQFLV